MWSLHIYSQFHEVMEPAYAEFYVDCVLFVKKKKYLYYELAYVKVTEQTKIIDNLQPLIK